MIVWGLLLLFPGQEQSLESKDFSRELERSARLATVRVSNEARHLSGSGVIIAQKGQIAYLLTASHLLEKVERVTVSLFSAKSYPREELTVNFAEVIARNKDSDLALVKFVARVPVPGVLPICPPGRGPDEKAFAVLTVGCTEGGPPICLIERVTDKKLIRKPDTKAAAWAWKTTSKPAEGRSGGPLIDKRGYLLGVCSGTSDSNGYYCHIDEIHAFLKANGFQSLYGK